MTSMMQPVIRAASAAITQQTGVDGVTEYTAGIAIMATANETAIFRMMRTGLYRTARPAISFFRFRNASHASAIARMPSRMPIRSARGPAFTANQRVGE